MTMTKSTLSIGNGKSFAYSQTFKTPMQQLVVECQCVDRLQSFLDYCNKNILKNFQLNLMMEYDNIGSKEEEFKLE